MSPAYTLYLLLREKFPNHTQAQLGAEVGVSGGNVSQWKKGLRRDISRTTAKLAAKKLGLTLDELEVKLREEGPPTPPRGISYDPEAPPV